MKKLLVAILVLVYVYGYGQAQLQPPHCKKIPKTDTIHGKILTDNYYWLKNRNDPAVMKYLDEENAYTDAVMKPTVKLQQQLYDEILSRIKQTDESVPYKLRGYWYYTRTEEGENYPIYCRKKGSMESSETVLLNVNNIVKEKKYYGIYGHEISPDNEIMAYYVDKTGNFEADIFFRNLTSNTPLSDSLHAVTSLVWANDNKTLFYSIQDSTTNRSFKVYKHILGTPTNSDELVYYEQDPLYDVYLEKSKSDQYIFLDAEAKEQSEVRYLNANRPNGKFKTIHPREKGHLYSAYHCKDKFYILTDKDAVNFKLMSTDTAKPSIENWTEVIPTRDSVTIEEIEIFDKYLVLTENQTGLNKIRVINRASGEGNYIPLEEESYYAAPSYNPDFTANTLRFSYESLKTPPTVYEYNMDNKEQKLLKRKEILGGYDPENYVTERIWATASDGTKVPMSLVYRKGLQKNGKNPAFVEGYGAYGYSFSPYFDTYILDYLNRGFVYAIAHVRGGGDLGRGWYEDGKLLKKKNTFSDFIACVEKLIDDAYTSKGLVVAKGASAGGLLSGNAANFHPELFKTIIMDVPFVDIINTMSDTSIPLTTQEYEEWGNPLEKDYFEYMYSYSPYDNVKAQDYPNMLFLTGLTDEQVGYWEPSKMVAKLRDLKTDNNKLLLKIEMSSGHAGASGRYNYYKEVAFEQAFVLTTFNIWK